MPWLYERRTCFQTIIINLSKLVYFSPSGSSDDEDSLILSILFSRFKLQCRVCSTSLSHGSLGHGLTSYTHLIHIQAELMVRLNIYGTYRISAFISSTILLIVSVLPVLCGTQIFRCPVSFDLRSHFRLGYCSGCMYIIFSTLPFSDCQYFKMKWAFYSRIIFSDASTLEEESISGRNI